MNKKLKFLFSLLSLATLLIPIAARPAQGQAQLGEVLAGRLEISWGDSNSEAPAVSMYTIETAQNEIVELSMPDPLPISIDELIGLRGQPVLVQGQWESENGKAGSNFSVSAISAAPGAVPEFRALVAGSQPWVSLLCKFSDYTGEPKSPYYFQDMYRSTYPGMDHHWREQSFDLMNVSGSDATNQWYILPQPRSYYVYNMDADPQLEFDHTRATNDCTGVANAEIYFPSFVGINMMFNADLDGYAWGGSRYMTLDGFTRTWYTTWEPPWGYDDITVIAHEMGHGFGLPHSSGEYGQTYDNQWDVMSDTWSNCGRSTDLTFGCLGQHTNSYHKDRAGWVGSRLVTIPLYSSATITLEQLALPQTGNALMVKIPINGSNSLYYTVEARRNGGTGYDVKLPGSAVIIHEVNTGRSIPAHVKDSDGNGNTGDAGAQWTVGETFTDLANLITINVSSATSSGFVVTICNACNQPTPIPTPTPPPPILHAGDLDNNSTLSGSKWSARVVVTVHDANDFPVTGATVSGTWSNGAKGSGSCTTTSAGQCTITKANISTRTASATFRLTSISKSGFVYAPGNNHDPDTDPNSRDYSDGTVIVIKKP